MDKEKVLKLASLARLKMSDEEAEHLSQEFGAILNYVGDVKAVSNTSEALTPQDFPLRNIMRDDVRHHESGLYSAKLLAEASHSEKGYIEVKKILS